MKNFQGKQQQQGLALLAALLIIVIFAIIGLTTVRNARESEKVAGADVRYGAVFEAGEETLRNTVKYLDAISGVPKAGMGNANIAVATNFDDSKAKDETNDFRRSDTFIWSREDLLNTLTPFCSGGKCQGFTGEVDNQQFWAQAVPSDFKNKFQGKNMITGSNYINHIQTYTFVEELKSTSIDITKANFGNRRLDAGGPGPDKLKKKSFYLITIKSSGFPPGIARTAQSARENVIIQAVFVKIDKT